MLDGVKLTSEIDRVDYQKIKDEDMVRIAQDENLEALEQLLQRYKSFVRLKARSYFLTGGDKEDIIQEGMIGLYKAIRDYDINKLTTFRSFAEICITRQIITAIKMATRQKHIPLNSYISFYKPIYHEGSERKLLDVLSSASITDPEDLIISSEELYFIETKVIELLSDLEWEIFIAYLDGKSYEEISIELGRHIKTIDNALQRVKRKFDKYVELNEY